MRFLFITTWPVHRRVAASPTSSTRFELVRTAVCVFWMWPLLPFPLQGTQLHFFLLFVFPPFTGQSVTSSLCLRYRPFLIPSWTESRRCDGPSWGAAFHRERSAQVRAQWREEISFIFYLPYTIMLEDFKLCWICVILWVIELLFLVLYRMN